MECMLSQLDLFSTPPIQSSILRTEKVSYNPITSLENSGTIDFHIPGNGDTYRDMSSIQMLLTVQIVDNTPALQNQNAQVVYGVNNLFHSMFRQCTVFLNNAMVSHDDTNYHYKCFFETILNYGRDASVTHLKNVGWFLDEGTNINSTAEDGPNRHILARKRLVYGKTPEQQEYNHVQFIGRLHIDAANIQKYLPSGVDIRISLVKENPTFFMLSGNQHSMCDVRILEASLSIHHVHINPQILLAHHQVLSSKNAVYPFKKTTVRQYTINAGTYNLTLDNVIIGQLPNIIVFGMVSNTAYSGNYTRNPFYFKHYGLLTFGLYVNGNLISGKPIVFEHSDVTGEVLTKGYETLFSGTGINFADKGHLITPQLYKDCYFLLMFDLTADHSYNSDCTHMFNEGTVRIEGTFKEALPETVTCLLYCEFDALMEIDKNKNVFVT
uniref:CSON004537 protein n=1 Tax=Culicoides sonorensis TaxID=179676 RepID=A0A336MPY8_CULSO